MIFDFGGRAMAQTEDDTPEPVDSDADTGVTKEPVNKPQFNKMAMLIIAAIIITVGGAIAAVFAFIDSERQRDIQAWQVRLGIVADSRSADINAWVDQNFDYMKELSQNASLQLYMSDLEAGLDEEPEPEPDQEDTSQSDADLLMGETTETEEDVDALEEEEVDGEDEAASASYLRNLLIATADRTGFKAPPATGEVAANIERAGVAGIGLVNADGQALVATPDMPPLTKRIRKAIASALDGEPTIIDIFSGAAGDPTIGFVLPVYGVQDDGDGAKGIGAVVGLRIVGEDLFERMKQPGETSESSETYLVRAKGATVEYLTPLADGTPALKKSMSSDTPDLAAAYGISRPGGFAIKVDYAGTEVLAASRQIANLPWVLMRKISRTEALSATDTRLTTILGVFIAIIVIVTLAILYVWKKGASMRATQALHDAEIALERFGNMSKFMKVVTDNQPNHIIAVDENTTYTFANGPAADEAGISIEDMMGKTMASVIGPVKAQKYAELNKEVLATFEKAANTTIFGDEDGEDEENPLQVIRSFHVPLRGDRDFPPAVLMILSDITELTSEKRRGEKMMRQLTDTLVSVVDRRDPFSANHSSRVAEVSSEIAKEMGLEEIHHKTVDVAGNLMNLGKIFIPEDVLTKVDDLTAEERAMMGKAYLTTVDLLEGVEFEGPVVETIRQFGETWDGRGPLGLKDEEIIIPARILAVANAFVGMVSARAYREAMPFQKAADILLGDAGTRYDRRPITALLNFLDNRDGTTRWAHFRKVP
jgi:HD-GYP domain-containing protein (c-di-GMP phosphodiesterase class II)